LNFVIPFLFNQSPFTFHQALPGLWLLTPVPLYPVLSLSDIQAAKRRIKGGIYYSPCPRSEPLSEAVGAQIFCKLDHLQRTGSFKERGARNALLLLDEERRHLGVIAASAGNHALGLAYHGKLLGIPVTVVMPQYAPLIKITTCQRLNANVMVAGNSFAAARERADELAQEKRLTYPAVGANAFEIARTVVDQFVVVSENEIALAILRILELEKSVVEGAAASTLAALLSGRLPKLAGKRVVLPFCGGNIDPGVLNRVIERGLVADGRLFRFIATISDRPGGLAALTKVIAGTGASVKEITHDRTFCATDVSAVQVSCVVETRDQAHIEELRKALAEGGIRCL
jgi:threonine dehydratase